jgi:hypothetical protein
LQATNGPSGETVQPAAQVRVVGADVSSRIFAAAISEH